MMFNGKRDRDKAKVFDTLRRAGPDGLMLLDDDEFFDYAQSFLLKKARTSLSFNPTIRWNLDNYVDGQCKLLFRFTHYDLLLLRRFFFGPNNCVVKTSERDSFDSLYGLCLFLRVISGTDKYSTLAPEFGKTFGPFSRIFHRMLQIVTDIVVPLMQLDVEDIKQNADLFIDAIQRVTDVATGTWGWADGSVVGIGMSTPAFEQRKKFFNGHKSKLGLNYGAILKPNGHVAYCTDAYPGSYHDSRVFVKSGILPKLRELHEWRVNQGHPEGMCIWADKGYGKSPGLKRTMKENERDTSPNQAGISDLMAEARTEIEHHFAIVKNNFDILQAQFAMTLKKRRIARVFLVAIFFVNCLVSAEGGSQVSDKFAMAPPSLPEYLRYCDQILSALQ
jgi:DDE superfamily endonuclease